MNCRRARRWISAMMDGELPAARRFALEQHLGACEGCRLAREEWSALGARFREQAVAPGLSGEAVWGDVRRAIRLAETGPAQEVAGAGLFGVRLRWAAAALTVVFVGLAGLVVGRRLLAPRAAELARGAAAHVESVETGLPGAMPMVYEDAESGVTIIWVVETNPQEDGHAGT